MFKKLEKVLRATATPELPVSWRRARVPAVLLLAGLLLSLVATVRAATLSWSGSTGAGANANWNNTANWGFAGTPSNGDTLIFSSGQPDLVNTNNITNLTLNQIIFAGAAGGYDLRGNTFTLTDSIQATNTTGTETIENGIMLTTGSVALNVNSGVSLILDGEISGAFGVTKTGTGSVTYQFAGDNTYAGTTLVAGGTLFLNVAGASAFGGPLVIGDGTGSGSPMVEHLQSTEISDVAPITINANGILNLNNFVETISSSLTMDGGTIETGTGTLDLSANTTISTLDGSESFIEGNLNTGSGTLTIDGNGFLLYVSASVSGGANIVENDSVNVFWTGANTYSGNYTANGSGYVGLANSQALGNVTNTMTVNGTAWVPLDNVNITNQSLTINSTNSTGALYAYFSSNSWHANFILDTAATIDVLTNCSLTLNINSQITGPGGIVKTDVGPLTLSGGANVSSYTGDTVVDGGTLFLNSINVIRHGTLMIGDGAGGPQANVVRYLVGSCIFGGPGGNTVVITSSGWLDLNGFTDDVGPVYMDGGLLTTGAGQLQLFPPLATYASTNGPSTINGNFQFRSPSTLAISNQLNMNAAVSSTGNYAITKTGYGFLYLTASNSYTGTNLIQQGWVYIENGSALGAPTNSTIVDSGATLAMNGNFTVAQASLTLNGPGEPAWGALDMETDFGTNTWSGPITLNADTTIAPYGTGALFNINGVISGPGGFSEFSNGGDGTNAVLTLEGGTGNSYGGTTTVSSGTLFLDKVNGTAVPGNLVIAGASSVARLGASLQTANTADVLINSGGLFDFSSFNTYLDTLRGQGTVNFGTNGWIWIGLNNGTSEFDGSFTGAGFAPGWTLGKTGSGNFTTTGTNTFTLGNTTIEGTGTMFVDGPQPQAAVIVESGATLAGNGTVGAITVDSGGTVAPGDGIGILNSGSVTFTGTGDTFRVTLGGPGAGTGYDQLNMTGADSLNNTTLAFTPAFTNPVTVGQQFNILNHNGGSTNVGTFSGLPEGATISAGGYSFTISYVGGSGNDIVLTLTTEPSVVVGSAVTSGSGSHGIDPNDCINLSLAVSNLVAAPMTGVHATLSTTTEGVLVTQPYADYPDIPVGGTGTNLTPFQISTVPSFDCGTPINFQLSVDSSLNAFTTGFVQPSGELPAQPNHYDNNQPTVVLSSVTAYSTNQVAGFIGPLSKVVVELFIGEPNDAQLTNISLIAPDGTTVLLSAANATGVNFGTSCSPDSARTTFDDAASTPISAGVAPYAGIYRPLTPLSVLNGNALPNGNWVLRVSNGAGLNFATLNCWSLLLYGTACSSGSGSCDVCMQVISNSVTAASLTQSNRWDRDGIVSSCGAPKTWSGFGDFGTSFHYDAYQFTNTSGADACVSVELQSADDLMAATYLTNYNANVISNNFLGDAGISTGMATGGITTYSCEIPNGATFVVVVNEVAENSGTQPFTLTLSGLPCPPPALSIQTQPTNQAVLSWPTWAGGYLLESEPALAPGAWSLVTNEPIVNGYQYSVTNSDAIPTNQFYRLHKP